MRRVCVAMWGGAVKGVRGSSQAQRGLNNFTRSPLLPQSALRATALSASRFSMMTSAKVLPFSVPLRGALPELRLEPSLYRNYSAGKYPPHKIIVLPALSPTMEKGNLVEWKKKEGDFVGNSAIAVIETDKSTMDWEYPDDGYLAKILVQPSEGLTVGQALAVVVDDEADIAAFKDFKLEIKASSSPQPSSPAPASSPSPAPASSPSPSPSPKSAPPSAGRTIASPFAKVQAKEANVDISSISGSGPGGRVIAKDVASAVAQQQDTQLFDQAPIVGTSFTDIPHTNIRKVIASRLTQSKQQIPHYYLTVEVRVDELQRVRGLLNAEAEGKFKLSVNDFVIKASSLALKRVPQCNSSWTDTHVRRFHNTDINVALNTDSGLLTPVIPNVETLGLTEINERMKELSTKGRDGKLTPLELSTGTFTISNLGGFGISQFCAVINPPQSCILAVSTSAKKLIPSDDTEEGFEVAELMTVTMSCDHRVVDGAVGAQWLKAFKSYLENPLRMLL